MGLTANCLPLSLNILDTFGSEDYRVAYIKTVISGYKFASISLYAPSQYEPDFFSNVTTVLSHPHDLSLIIGADMNTCINVALDKSAQYSTATQL